MIGAATPQGVDVPQIRQLPYDLTIPSFVLQMW